MTNYLERYYEGIIDNMHRTRFIYKGEEFLCLIDEELSNIFDSSSFVDFRIHEEERTLREFGVPEDTLLINKQ